MQCVRFAPLTCSSYAQHLFIFHDTSALVTHTVNHRLERQGAGRVIGKGRWGTQRGSGGCHLQEGLPLTCIYSRGRQRKCVIIVKGFHVAYLLKACSDLWRRTWKDHVEGPAACPMRLRMRSLLLGCMMARLPWWMQLDVGRSQGLLAGVYILAFCCSEDATLAEPTPASRLCYSHFGFHFG